MKIKEEGHLPSIDEIIATINHSFLPVVFIEGKDDAVVFRNLEDKFFDFNLSVFPMGGRDRVLELYKRRDEISGVGRFCFIADQDTWVYSGVPHEFIDPLIIFTTGYSIENDIYIDGELEGLLSKPELSTFCDELNKFLKWYSVALSRHLVDDTFGIVSHPNQVLECQEFFNKEMTLLEGEKFPDVVFEDLLGNYHRKLRGKSLFSLLIRQLSYKARPVKQSKLGVMEMIARRKGPLISRFDNKVELALNLTL